MFRLDKFTLKSQEAIQNALQLAEEFSHQQVEPEHLSFALLKDKEGVIPMILERVGVAPDTMLQKLEEELKRKPKVEGQAPFLQCRKVQ